ncbi:putative ammonium transporter 1 [Aplysia californica]|uniref:Ammonium transporter n=1 Tax=Aplysia californica TaxID=6500 RepID=A0ABM0ZZD6_APLCA|nr:putative ammonium transporter 1 [Aplysia californica]
MSQQVPTTVGQADRVTDHNSATMTSTLEELKTDLDRFFLVVMGMIVYLMQCGFAFLEAGSVRSKNTSNILIKNLLDSFVAGISYWILGYPFAFGSGNSFIGWHNWASHDLTDGDLAGFFFQFVFAATAATIVSGALAERCEFVAYFIYSFCITGIVYPVVTHWVWSSQGWLSAGDIYTIDGLSVQVGYQDFAGSGVVHCVGGVAAFVGAAVIGPRLGRFHEETGTSINLRGHSVPFAALGGFILLFGFMAFNGGSQLSISNPGDGAVVSLAIVNTVISGSMAAFLTLALHRTRLLGTRKWSLLITLNGALAGMVAICAGCNVIRPWGACVVGLVAGIFFNFTSWAMVKLRIDDPLDAVAVHFGGGSWGVLSVALLKYVEDDPGKGLLIDWDRQAGLMLAWQLAGLAAIIAWTGGLCIIMFGLLRLGNILRVSPELERKGLDIPKHGEPAYPLESYGHGYLEKIMTILENGQLSASNLGCESGRQANGWNSYESAEVHAMKVIGLARVEQENGRIERKEGGRDSEPGTTEQKRMNSLSDHQMSGQGKPPSGTQVQSNSTGQGYGSPASGTVLEKTTL